MNHQRRLATIVLTCLLTGVLVLVSAPAQARRGFDLHKGSKGPRVTTLEVRLAHLGLLTPSAVDRRFRAATVHSVRHFQRQLGVRQTGHVKRWLWNAIAREPARRAAVRAPLVIGHRGEVAAGVGENTLASLQAAAPYVDMLEFDLQITSDHQLVLMHDPTLDRTTNCAGPVSGWTLADLQAQCRVGNQPIPTFDEVATFAAQAGKQIAPELKNGAMTTADLQQVASTITDHGLLPVTWLQSYYGSLLTRMRGELPGLRTMLVSGGAPSATLLKSLGVTGVAAKLDALTLPRVADYHHSRLSVWAWTARSSGEIGMARGLYVNGTVTDAPRAARAIYR